MAWIPTPYRQQQLDALLQIFNREEDGKHVVCSMCQSRFQGRNVDVSQWVQHLKKSHPEAYESYRKGDLARFKAWINS